MNRKILTGLISLAGVPTFTAQALEAPAAATPVPAGAQLKPLSRMPPALSGVFPQADPATVRLVWQAVLGRFPEIVDGPERTGTFVVAISLRPDGSVVRSGMRYVEKPLDLNANQQALRDLLPTDGDAVPGMGGQPKGAALPGDRVLKGRVILNAQIVPANWDETRDSGLVRRAVLQKHADLFLPRAADRMNELTVVMNDKGEIASERVKALTVEHEGTMSRITGGCKLPPRPAGFAEFRMGVDEAVAGFAAIGLGPDQMGMAGKLSMSLPVNPVAVSQLARPTIGADGISRGTSPFADPPQLQVCYAWLRRPGEPVGGTPLLWDSIRQQQNGVSTHMLQLDRLIENYFPSGSPADGNWMLLTFNSEVLRTGHVELGKDEHLTNTYVERMFPGIKIVSSMGTGHTVNPKNPGEPPHELINVQVYFLAADSPLPPAEDVLLPVK